MENSVLELVAKLTSYDADIEMHRLGESIFFGSEPTSEDIDKLNQLRGFEPIMYTYEDEQVKQYIYEHANLFDIFGKNNKE